MDNFIVHIIDCDTRHRPVRTFGLHENRITDMAFNNENRWLITACMDSVIRVWDMLTGLMIDAFCTSSPCVSLTLSPSGEFLATAHADDVGIYLWSNISVYTPITIRPLNDKFEPQMIAIPCVRSDEDDDEINEVIESDDEETTEEQMDVNVEDIVYKSPEQLSEELITISRLPQSRWKNLLNLDLIKVCIETVNQFIANFLFDFCDNRNETNLNNP